MIPKQILKKVKQVEIRTRGLVNDLFGGEYHSVFKGRGMAFSEVREYQPGDDIRLIDWNVTARNGSPFIKIFEALKKSPNKLLKLFNKIYTENRIADPNDEGYNDWLKDNNEEEEQPKIFSDKFNINV